MSRYDEPPRPPRGYDDRSAYGASGYEERDRYDRRPDPRYDRDLRASYTGPIRGGDRDHDIGRRGPPAGYPVDPAKRGFDRDLARSEHDPRARYAPYPNGRAADPYYQPAVSPYLAPPAYPHEHVERHQASMPTRTFDAAARRPDTNSQFHHGPVREKSSPSQTVILMGLPAHTDESNLRAFLEDMGCSIDGCTIIYDRETGQSKRYGFARFISVEHARAFVDPHFPIITWKEPRGSRYGDSGDGLKIKIDYSQKEKLPFEQRISTRTSGRPGADRGSNARHATSGANGAGYRRYSASESPSVAPINDGARDIGGSPTSILLLRGLDPLSTEQDIATNLQNIPDPSQTVGSESVKKVMLIKDRNTRGSWGFAFVHFADVQVAVKALSLLLNQTIFPRGFQIKSRTITVTFAHENSFHPVYTRSDWSFRGEGGQELAYWDDKAYASLWTSASGVQPTGATGGSGPAAVPDQDKAIKDDVEMDAFLSSIDEEMPPPLGMADSSTRSAAVLKPSTFAVPDHPAQLQVPQALSTNGGSHFDAPVSSNGHQAAPPAVPQAEVNSQPSLPEEHGFLQEAPKGDSNGAIGSKKTAANIAKWTQKHAELITRNNGASGSGASGSGPSVDTPEKKKDLDFADLVKMTCLLCQRQFKSTNDLGRHVEISQLHQTNLQDEDTKTAARQRRAATLQAQQEAAYTDRAAQRREVYNQPNAPVPGPSVSQPNRSEPAPVPVLPPSQPDKEGIRDSNVGSVMLERMGWSKGEGLGQGGRVDPVLAAQYAQGVGLGASSGTAVGRYDESSRGRQEQMRDKMQERADAAGP